MALFELTLVLLLIAVALTAVSRWLEVPYPSLLALAGVGIAFVPGAPMIEIDPELALALFIAPVLLDAAYDTSLRDLKRYRLSLVLLALGAVIFTTVVVAFVGWKMAGLPIAAAIALGAIVAPPDAVAASAVLGQFKESNDADKLVNEWLSAAGNGTAPPELLLDITEAAQVRAKPTVSTLRRELKKGLEKFEGSKLVASDSLAPWKESLAGGDADKGRAIFLTNSAVYCQRCHKLDGQGGEVGPPLNGIAAQPDKDRRYLLESVVQPSAKIAKGYETAILTLVDGRLVTGVVKEDTKKQIRLVTAENKELVIPADDIESRRTGPSAMPDDLHKKLSRRELRDLVEFLASLNEPEKKGGP